MNNLGINSFKANSAGNARQKVGFRGIDSDRDVSSMDPKELRDLNRLRVIEDRLKALDGKLAAHRENSLLLRVFDKIAGVFGKKK